MKVKLKIFPIKKEKSERKTVLKSLLVQKEDKLLDIQDN